MKKYLPFVILGLGLLVVVISFFVLRSRNNKNDDVETDEEEVLPEIAFEKRPAVSLTPTSDGHWLKLRIGKILIDAASLDYELTYKIADGRTQGVPGSVKLTSKDDIERELLLGSESSGKFRYDEGVKNGNLTLRFRDSNGKLVAKFATEFMLQSGEKELSSNKDKIYTLDKLNAKAFYVYMDTFGYPGSLDGTPKAAFGIFSSSETGNSGVLDTASAQLWYKNEWNKLEDGKSPDLGFFVTLS